MGHNLGLMHDFDKRHGGTGTAKSAGWPNGRCETNQNIMSYESSEKKWSECNKLDFEAHYVKHKAHWCMDSMFLHILELIYLCSILIGQLC